MPDVRPDARRGAVLALSIVAIPVLLALAPASGRETVGYPAEIVSGADFTVVGALSEVPVSGEHDDVWQVSIADLAAATELAGLARPTTPAPGQIAGWMGPLTGISSQGNPVAPVFVPLPETFSPGRLAQTDEFVDELGWSVLDVDAFVEWSAPPRRFAVVTGAFDAPGIESRLTETAPGVFTAGNGEDLSQDFDDTTVARPLGRPLHITIDGDHMAVSLSTRMVEAWLAGDGRSLADDDSLVAVAKSLDAADVVAAFLVGERNDGTDTSAAPDDSKVTTPAGPDSYTAVGIGWSLVDGEAVMSVVYDFGEPAAAANLVEPFRSIYTDGVSFVSGRPLSTFFSVDDVASAGRTVTVTLRPVEDVDIDSPLQMLFTRDLPFPG